MLYHLYYVNVLIGFLLICEQPNKEILLMEKKVIQLPNREEMLRRLLKVCDESHFQEKFYPILLERAGQTIVAQGIVIWFTLAIHDYSEGMPKIISNLVYAFVPRFIETLIDDLEVAEEAKSIFNEAIKASRQLL